MKYHGIKKLYYSISEISDMLDLKQSVIRYWEGEFKELKPQKNRAGNRIYKKDDIPIIQLIHHYVHEKHLSIHDTKEMIQDLKTEGLYKRKLKELTLKLAAASKPEEISEAKLPQTGPLSPVEPSANLAPETPSAPSEELLFPAEEISEVPASKEESPTVSDQDMHSEHVVRELLQKISGNIREIIDILNESK
ncbi:MAG: MerR family transcriptional regulator [Candidatus Marinimicrobia bacterium]|nr:MerR family transcriptional regulator [Candidatus Neomarinimicrobiota bacterium]